PQGREARASTRTAALDHPGQTTDDERLDTLHASPLPSLSHRPSYHSTAFAEHRRGSVSAVSDEPGQRVDRAARCGLHPAWAGGFVGVGGGGDLLGEGLEFLLELG
ncbi:hypothetical protein, partial [Pseudoclavibacter helvolus]|uniref:hypothetical protein n=1 Tax=Pseudoclavibacter helvolus TaxID=255205 RepID=UPI001ABF7024